MNSNPFPYSDDNLRYHSYSYYLKHKYHQKLCKVPLDGGFTCPNRDGSLAMGGCLFCSGRGSGEFVQEPAHAVVKQYQEGLATMRKKWPDALGIAYFQAYTNTYAPLPVLQELFEPFVRMEEVPEIAIATRPDCLDEEKIAYLSMLNRTKPITVELGLQSIQEETMQRMNRGHSGKLLQTVVPKLKQAGLRVSIHIINGLPNETTEMMLSTAQAVADMHADGIKIHMLNILKDAPLYELYKKENFALLSLEDYVNIVVKQLEILPPEMVIERLTGDGMEEQLVAPLWVKRKTVVRNEITKRQKAINSYQGKAYAPR